MKLDVRVSERVVAKLYRERDEYVLSYLPDTNASDFVSLTMPVREEPWRWPRDLHPLWNEGMMTLRSSKNEVAFRGLDDAIAHAGFSEPEKPESSREVIGRSELLARPRTK